LFSIVKELQPIVKKNFGVSVGQGPLLVGCVFEL